MPENLNLKTEDIIDAINKKIAQRCGWKNFCLVSIDGRGQIWIATPPAVKNAEVFMPIPDYTDSHDAIYQAISTLTPRQKNRYVGELWQNAAPGEADFLNEIRNFGDDAINGGETMYRLAFATSEQRARAFLRATD